ncbi:MAG: SurA N-terminal domain-containing protein [Burkholderiaceae bacterium]
MFDAIRKHNKIIMWILALLVFPSFIFFGIEGYGRFNEGANKVAEVDGHAITQTEWDNAHRLEVDRARSANPTLDLNLLDSPLMKYGTLERLVRDRVLAAAAQGEHLGVSDAALAAALEQDPAIASLRGADGRLDMEGYKRLLAAQGLTPEGFEARMRSDLSMQQVLGGIANSELVSQANVDAAMNAFLERREVRVLRLAPKDFASKVTPTEADLQGYYKTHEMQYQVPESVKIEYIVLDLDSVKKSVSVSEQELRTYYEQNAATLGTPEERRASHILVAVSKDAPAAEREKAKATAEKLLAEVRADPRQFAEIAKRNSNDDVSAPSGGDLGWFQQQKGTDPTIAQATFKLAKVGDISDLVQSDFGYHIIELTGIKPAKVPPFEQERAKLDDQLRTQQAQKQFTELADTFTNGVYEQSDSLKPVADKLKLTIHTADGVTRTPTKDATGALANAKFLSALFSADALSNKRNTEAIEVGPNQLASGRVLAHTAAHAKPFAEVQDAVRSAYIAQRSAEMARQDGQAKLKAWLTKPASATGLPAAIAVSRDAPQDQPAALVEAVLRADPAKLPHFVGVDLGADGYAIAQIEKVLPPAEQNAEQKAQNRSRYIQLWSLAEVRSDYELLKARYKARILVPMPKADALGAVRQ